MENETKLFNYLDLHFLDSFLEHKSPPFIKFLNPEICVLNTSDNTLLFIDFDELYSLNIIKELEADKLLNIKKHLLCKSIVIDKYIRVFFDKYNYTPCWKDSIGIAVGFTSNYIDDSSEIMNCVPIDYQLFTNEFLKIDYSKDPINAFLTVLNLPSIRNEDVLVKIHVASDQEFRCHELFEINHSLVDVCWEKHNSKSVDLFFSSMKLFVIGPNTDLTRIELRKILFYNGVNFEPSKINEYIWKLSYQFHGLDCDWNDVYNK